MQMRVAVIADVHGNCAALDAVLADLEANSADQIVCLGDMIQGGPQPAETVARLRDLGAPIVMGNADAYLLTGDESGPEPVTERLRATRQWSLSRLSAEDVAFITGFVPTVEVTLDGGRRLLAFHGSPASYDDLIFPHTLQEEVERLLGAHAPAIMTGGHTHVQQIRRVGAGLFFNPGSVGFAFRHGQPEATFRADPWAEYAVVTSEGERFGLEFRHVSFDTSAYVNAVHAGKMPDADAVAARYANAAGGGL
jgi:predicted phosphodiesterase